MRYSLEKDINGRITQCDNADGNNNVYAQRAERNQKAIENLARPTPGKLGDLNNLRVFNFQLSAFNTGNVYFVENTYNTGTDFPANVTDCLMFGVDSLDNKAQYYNIVSVNAFISSIGGSAAGITTVSPSAISFYLLQNIEGSTTSLGTKIPHPAPQIFTSGGSVSSSFNGNIYGNQRITIDLIGDTGTYAQNNQTKGLRCSGLALSEILLSYTDTVDTSAITIDVEILVDTKSVSQTL